MTRFYDEERMSSFNLASPTAEQRDACFFGIYPELCFVPSWLSQDKRGYVTFNARDLRGTVHAHRLVVMLLIGPLAFGDLVLHRCGNASCYNPFHLYGGGDAENRRDTVLHQQADRRWGPLGLTFRRGDEAVFMPHPLVLSAEDSRLAASFRRFTPGECVHCEWLYPTRDGYVQLGESSMSGDVVGAHRKVYALFNGPLTKYDLVGHACGDRTCVNPYHLFILGRHPSPRDFDFAHDGRFRLSSEGLAVIADFSKDAKEVARELGVHLQTVISRRAELRRAGLVPASRMDCADPDEKDVGPE